MGLGRVCATGKDLCIRSWLIRGTNRDHFCAKEVVKYLVIHLILSKSLIIALCLLSGRHDSDVLDDTRGTQCLPTLHKEESQCDGDPLLVHTLYHGYNASIAAD